jgi:phosphate-selective porin
MKSLKIISLLVIFVICSCDSNTSVKDNQDVNTSKSEGIVNKKKKRKPRIKNIKPDYWIKLKENLKLDNIQIKKLRKIHKEQLDEIKRLRNNKKISPKLKKEIRKRTNLEYRKVLGNKLFKRKINFDKTWYNK